MEKGNTLFDVLMVVGIVGGGLYLWDKYLKVQMIGKPKPAIAGILGDGASQIKPMIGEGGINTLPVTQVAKERLDFPSDMLQDYSITPYNESDSGWGPMNPNSPFFEFVYPNF